MRLSIPPTPFDAKKHSFFPLHCSRFAFCSRSLPLDSLLRPQPWTISRWAMISVSRILYPRNQVQFFLLSLSSFHPHRCCTRYHGWSVTVWSIGHVISIKSRCERREAVVHRFEWLAWTIALQLKLFFSLFRLSVLSFFFFFLLLFARLFFIAHSVRLRCRWIYIFPFRRSYYSRNIGRDVASLVG